MLPHPSAVNINGSYVLATCVLCDPVEPCYALGRCGQMLRPDLDHQLGKLFLYAHRSPCRCDSLEPEAAESSCRYPGQVETLGGFFMVASEGSTWGAESRGGRGVTAEVGSWDVLVLW